MDNLTTTQLASQFVGLADSIDLDAADFSPRQLARMRESLDELKLNLNRRWSECYGMSAEHLIRRNSMDKAFIVPGVVKNDALSVANAIVRYASAIDDGDFILVRTHRPETHEIIVTIIAKRFTEIARVVEMARYEVGLDPTTFMGGYVVDQKSLPGNHETVAYSVKLTCSQPLDDQRKGIIVIAPNPTEMP